MAIKETSHTYKYSWDLVTTAFWNKYPNPNLPHVESSDVVDRYVDADGRLRSARVARCRQDIPAFAQGMFGKFCFVFEESIVDPKKKTLTLRTRNISYSNLFQVQEECVYSPHASNAEWTEYKQEAKITAFVPFISRKIEQFSVKAGNSNAVKGLQTMEGICRDLFNGTFISSYAYCESANSEHTQQSQRQS